MTVSPFEVERREFGRSPMGYRRNEVDAFLEDVRRSLSELWEERATLRDEVERLTERLSSYSDLEDSLRNTLLLAHDSAERAGEQARREADVLLQEARQKARDIVHEAHQESQRLEQTTRELQTMERTTRTRLRSLAQDVLGRVDSELVVPEFAISAGTATTGEDSPKTDQVAEANAASIVAEDAAHVVS